MEHCSYRHSDFYWLIPLLISPIECSYCHSDFLLVDSSLNVFYGVTPFKQAQTVYTKNIKLKI